MAALLGGLDRADQEVGADAVGDEGLAAVDEVAAVIRLRGGAERSDVGAGSGLGDAERADLLALDPGHEPALLLPLVAELEDRRHRDRGVGVQPGRDSAGGTAAGELFDPDRVVQVACRPGRRTPRGTSGRGNRARRSGRRARAGRARRPPIRRRGGRSRSATKRPTVSRSSSCSRLKAEAVAVFSDIEALRDCFCGVPVTFGPRQGVQCREVCLAQFIPAAAAFSSSLETFLVPGIGAMSSPCARTQAIAIWAGVASYFGGQALDLPRRSPGSC